MQSRAKQQKGGGKEEREKRKIQRGWKEEGGRKRGGDEGGNEKGAKGKGQKGGK